MKTKFLLGGILSFCLLATNLGSVIAQNPGPESGPTSPTQVQSSVLLGTLPWSVQTIDDATTLNGNDKGAYPSIAFDPGNGIPYISYYDATAQTLLLASPKSSGGNCGPNNSWWCRTVENKTKIGRYSSIAIWRGTLTWALGITYVNDNTGGLRFAEWRCLLITCGWTYWNIVNQNNVAVTSPSLKYGTDGSRKSLNELYANVNYIWYTKWVGKRRHQL